MLRVPAAEAASTMARALEARGFERARAAECAAMFADASLDGVYTHGLERFARFVRYVELGYVDPAAEPVLKGSFGAWERWDGRLGPGNLNARASMARAVELARSGGMGCVALANTNHWMRGGAYGLQAAEAGCVGITWTNTMPNLPAWGAREPVLGNNPLIIAVPAEGGHVLLDMAMSQYSYGKLEAAAARGEETEAPCGWDEEGRMTRDPKAVLASRRSMPVGFWKGSGLSLLLDLAATILSGGDSVGTVGARGDERGLSQVFLAFDLSRLAEGAVRAAAAEMAARLRGAAPAEDGGRVRYPGERRLAIRAENLELGIPVREALWEEMLGLAIPSARG
jgi:3-dehydro-L-gulonate 2-dehydrogenase